MPSRVQEEESSSRIEAGVLRLVRPAYSRAAAAFRSLSSLSSEPELTWASSSQTRFEGLRSLSFSSTDPESVPTHVLRLSLETLIGAGDPLEHVPTVVWSDPWWLSEREKAEGTLDVWRWLQPAARRSAEPAPDYPLAASRPVFSGATSPSLTRIRELARRFVEDIRHLPQARQVLLEQRSGTPRIWTVIEAEPLDWTKREPVYKAELGAMEAYPAVEVSFRLVNLAEYEETRPDEILPSHARILWRR